MIFFDMEPLNETQRMSGLIRNALKLVSGNVVAQAIGIATMPLVTRLYSPADFGIFAVFISVLAVLGPVSTLRFNETIVLPETRTDAIHLLRLSCICAFMFSLVILILAGIYITFFKGLRVLDLGGNKAYLWLLPLGVFLRGSLPSINSMAIREARFKKMAIGEVLIKASDRFIVLAEGILTSLGAWGLIIGHLAGIGTGVTYMLQSGLRDLLTEIFRGLSFGEMKRLFYRYRQFPLYGTWSILLHTASKEMPVIILAVMFSSLVTGHYALGATIIYLPMIIAGYSLNKTFLQHAVSFKNRREDLAGEIRRILIYLTYLALPFILILFFLGDRIFGLFFGARWLEAGVYVQILAPSFFFVFLYIPLRSLFIIFERSRERLIFDFFYFILRGGSLFLTGLITQSARSSLMAMSIATCAYLFLFFFYASRLLERSRFFFVGVLFQKVLLMFPMAAGLLLIRFCLLPNMVVVSAVALVGLLVVQGVLFVLTDSFLRENVTVFIGMVQKN